GQTLSTKGGCWRGQVEGEGRASAPPHYSASNGGVAALRGTSTDGYSATSPRGTAILRRKLPRIVLGPRLLGVRLSPPARERLRKVRCIGRRRAEAMENDDRGRKASVPKALPPPEHWDEDETPVRRLLHLEASTYRVDKLFDLPPTKVDCFTENYVASPGGHFAYRNRILLGGLPLRLFGIDQGMVVWNGDVVIPMLLDMTEDSRSGWKFAARATRGERAKWGAVWMSMTPAEMLTQRSGVQAAEATVVIGGLGLGW